MQDIQKWNESAAEYQRVFRLGLSDYNKELLAFLVDEGMLRPGCRVIDIGCGVGKYGTYFAAMGCDVTLTDISSGMLEMAKANMSAFDTPWATLECDFQTVDPTHPVLREGFDLAISTMCPAIGNLESVKKISGMVRGGCFITHFTTWEEPLRKNFFEKLGIGPEENMNRFSYHIEMLVEAVKEAGYEPQIRHVPYGWCDERSAEEAADYLLRRIENLTVTAELREQAVAVARELCDERGVFVDAVNTTVAWVWWKTKGE